MYGITTTFTLDHFTVQVFRKFADVVLDLLALSRAASCQALIVEY
jgi:sarcosine oxidase gamma subunit